MNTLDLTPMGCLWEVYKLLLAKAETAAESAVYQAGDKAAADTPNQPKLTWPIDSTSKHQVSKKTEAQLLPEKHPAH